MNISASPRTLRRPASAAEREAAAQPFPPFGADRVPRPVEFRGILLRQGLGR